MKKFLMQPLIIYLGMAGGSILFLGVAYFNGPKDGNEPLFLYAGAIGALVGVALFLLLPRLVVSIRKAETPEDKAKLYLNAKILQLAPLEGASLFNAVVYFLTGDQTAFALAVIMVIIALYFRPSIDDFKTMMKASDRDVYTLE